MLRRIVCSFTCLALVGLVPQASRIVAEGPQKVTEIEGISEYHLDNGLRVLLFPDDSSPKVTVNLTIFVGSRQEGYGEAGMAHLLEHMLFKGTPTHPDIDKQMLERGARFNGTTWLDRTNYYETLPASDDNLEFAIRMEADRMVNSFIKAEDLASEMTVVRNEFERGEDSPSRVLMQRMHGAAYEWHNYGKSTIGNRSDIERVPIPALREFYRKHYQPDNAMLVVAGKFDQDKALEHIEKYFGSLPKPDRVKDATYTEEPPQDGERTVVVRRVGDIAIAALAYHIPASSHEDFAAVRVLNYILGMEPSGILYKALVETKKADRVSAYAFGVHDPGLIMMDAELPKGRSLEEVRKTMIDVVEAIGENGVSEEDTERAKREILKERELELTNSAQLAVSLSNWASQGDWRLYFIYRDRVEQVTAADVQRVAAKYLARNNRTVGLFIPSEKSERVAIPSRPDVEALVRDYKGREAIASGEQFDPSPANIEFRTTRESWGEMKVALLPKKTRGETVNLRLSLRFGNAENLKGLTTAAEILPTLMTRGTEQLSRQQIKDELDKNSAELNASGQYGEATFTLKTKRENLPAVLALLKQILREPSLPQEEFEVYRREQLTNLESSLTEPQVLAITKLRQILAPYPQDDVRYVTSVAEDVKKYNEVELEEVKKLYNEYLGARGELSLVGDFAPEQIGPLLTDMFDSWSSKMPYEHISELVDSSVKGGQQTIQIPDKANSVLYAGQLFSMRDDDPAYPALVIGNHILGGSSLASRLGDRVRQKEGLSYGIGSGVRANSLEPRASLTIGAISAPQNSPKVVVAVGEELERFLKDGITETELKRATGGYLQEQTLGRSNDAQLTSILNNTLQTDRTMEYYEEYEKRIEQLTADDIVNAFRKYIDPQRLVIVTAGDFKEKPAGDGQSEDAEQ